MTTKEKRGIWPLPVRRWGPEITCRMDRAESIPTPLVYTMRPIKVCMTAWLAVGTPNGKAYIVPTRSIYLCIALDLCSKVPTFKTTKNTALANTFSICSAPSLCRSDILRYRLVAWFVQEVGSAWVKRCKDITFPQIMKQYAIKVSKKIDFLNFLHG